MSKIEKLNTAGVLSMIFLLLKEKEGGSILMSQSSDNTYAVRLLGVSSKVYVGASIDTALRKAYEDNK